MTTVLLMDFFRAERDALYRSLAAAPDIPSAQSSAQAFLDRMQAEYIAAQPDPALRTAAAALFSLAKNSMQALLSASEARISLDLPSRGRRSGLPRELILRGLPSGLCALLCISLFMQNAGFPAYMALAATLLCAAQAFCAARSSALPEARAEIQVQPEMLLSSLEHALLTMDRILGEQAKRGQGKQEALAWTQQQLSGLQMLWEARQTQDGEYALKAIPSLVHSLEQQGVEVLPYSPDRAECFAPLPGAQAGVTIRPALLREGRVLARGQVTVEMLKGEG